MPAPSPRSASAGAAVRLQSRPGVFWPTTCSTTMAPRRNFPEEISSFGKPDANTLEDLQFFPDSANASASAPSTSSGVFALRQDIAAIQKQLGLVLEGQSETQATLLRVKDTMLNIEQRGATVPAVMGKAPSANGSPKNFVSPEACMKVELLTENAKVDESSPLAVHGTVPTVSSPSKGLLRKATTQTFGFNLQKKALHRMFTLAEEEEDNERNAAECKTWAETAAKYMSKDVFEMTIDSVMAVVISINAVFVGFSVDYSDGSFAWVFVDFMFSLIFVIELSLKLRLHGFRRNFCAKGKLSNILDVSLVFADLLQLTLDTMYLGGDESFLSSLPPASVFRMVRLLKIARVLRLLQTDFFKDLLDMIQGVTGGLSTLMWSMVFFLLVVYVSALAFREMLGRNEVENVEEYFDSVPRAMLSTFRCSFGDCNTATGVPIFEFVSKEYGAIYSIFYCLFIFSLTIGLFNVISAIFVESTMASAQTMALAKKTARLRDERLLATRVTRIIRCILKYGSVHEVAWDRLSEGVDELVHCEVERATVDHAMGDPEAEQALDELDINPQDRARLSDIFDPDNGGTVSLSDIASGIRRLRGDPRRSDIVCVDLMIRSLQAQVKELNSALIPPEANDPS